MISLIPEEFNALLNDIGQATAWRRSNLCPCVVEYSGAASQGCLVCSGRGHFWDAPVLGMTGLSGQKIMREWMQSGNAELGDVVFTIPSDSPLYDIAPYDRVTLVNSSAPWSASFVRGSEDFSRHQIVDVDRVMWMADDGASVEYGDAPIVADDGAFSWAQNGPPVGIAYSMSGRVRPEYFVWGDYPSDRAHHSGRRLPRRVVMRKFDLFGR